MLYWAVWIGGMRRCAVLLGPSRVTNDRTNACFSDSAPRMSDASGGVDPHWPVATHRPELSHERIDIWRIDLTLPPDPAGWMAACLSPDESQRAARFLFDRHRERFLAGRARVRAILARYLGAQPSELVFDYEPLGKPSLRVPNAGRLSFNFSNSHDLGLLAVTGGELRLGLDVEYPRVVRDYEGLARRFFHASESQRLRTLPSDVQVAAFFRLWTRKEAFLKAVGKGLTFPLHRVIVSVEDAPQPTSPAGSGNSSRPESDRGCGIVSIDDSHEEASRWQLVHLEPPGGYIAAVAHDGPQRSITCWSWHDDWTR